MTEYKVTSCCLVDSVKSDKSSIGSLVDNVGALAPSLSNRLGAFALSVGYPLKGVRWVSFMPYDWGLRTVGLPCYPRLMTKCPACTSDRFHGAPVGYKSNGQRCEVCLGWGITTLIRIMGWELSL